MELSKLYVFTYPDSQGDEGIAIVTTDDGRKELFIAGDEERLQTLMPLAEAFAERAGAPVTLREFTAPRTLKIFSPSTKKPN